jgi:RHS repeat-associated protein
MRLDTEKLFVYDGWNLIKEITKTGASSSDKYYVWGLDLSQSLQGAGGIGGLVCAVSAGEVRHYFFDGNGNVGQVVNDDGSIAAHYEYDPFGNIVNGVPQTDDNPFRFSTKYYDEETGLYYYGYRYYSEELGRWWSRDPIGEKGGYNLYLFVQNNPIVLTDPLGWEVDNVNTARDPFDLTLIPGIMRANNMINGAILLEKWFRNPPLGPNQADTTTIKMDWVLGYDRAKKVYDEIISNKIYANKYAAPLLKKRIISAGKQNGGIFGNFDRPVPSIDKEYVNQRSVGSMLDPLDDLLSALGRFNLHVAVRGEICLSSKHPIFCISIEEIGVYVVDSFDFDGDQPLGIWNYKTNAVSRINIFNGHPVSNLSFRQWREENKMGGDFLVYSDIKRKKLNPPEIVCFDY